MPRPPKKSEIGNSWYEKKRNKKILEAPEKHLILCEGEETEYNYFDKVKCEINSKYRDKITLDVISTGEGRLTLLNIAQRMAKKLKVNHVWLVYDKDDFDDSEFDNTVHKIQELNKTSEIQYHALWSNQCIEVWFLMHFIDLKVDISRKDYIVKLNENFKRHGINEKYSKNDKEIYDKLKPYREVAKKRARKIIKENEEKAPSKIAPASTIFEIFDMLDKYL